MLESKAKRRLGFYKRSPETRDRIVTNFLNRKAKLLGCPLRDANVELNDARHLARIFRAMRAKESVGRQVMASKVGTSLSELEHLIRAYHERWKRAADTNMNAVHERVCSEYHEDRKSSDYRDLKIESRKAVRMADC